MTDPGGPFDPRRSSVVPAATPTSTTIATGPTAAADVAADPWSAHCLNLHRDPEVAAEDLKAAVGGRAAAYRWAVALIAEVGR